MHLLCKLMCLFFFVHAQSSWQSEKTKKPASFFHGVSWYPNKSFYPSVATVQSTLAKRSPLLLSKSLEHLITIRYLVNQSDLNLLAVDCYDTRIPAENSDAIVRPYKSSFWNRSVKSFNDATMQFGFQFFAQYPVSPQDDRYVLHGPPIYYQCSQNKITGGIEVQQDQGTTHVVTKHKQVGKNLIDLYFLKQGENRIAIVSKQLE
jgi:hypothetical protein